jgi:plasmid stabilization system protein ParE
VNPPVFHPEAADEVRAAVSWYGDRSSRAAAEFLGELDEALGKIRQSPERWRRVLGPWRRYVLRRFPFLIIYRETSHGIEVVAIAHGRPGPGYWRSRIE